MDRLIRLAAKVPPANSVFKLPARRRSQSFFFNVIWLTLVIASAIPFSSFAQNTTADQQEQRERTERQAREREQRQSVPQIGQPDDKNRVSRYSNTDLPSEQACFRIDALALQGDRADEFAFAQRYLNRYAGRCLGQESISLIVRRVSDLVLARGYVTTRIGLPEQNLSEGTLTLLLVPGTIREIRFTGNESDSLWCSAFPARPGGLLNLRSLEQGLEQIKRVPSQDASMEIIPGELPSLDDLGKLIGQFKLPGLDVDALVDWQRKDMEALAEANRQAYDGIKALVERRNEILQETLAQWQDALKNAAGKDALALNSEAAKEGVQQAIANFRELSSLEAQARSNTWKVVQDRLQENMANLQKLLQPK